MVKKERGPKGGANRLEGDFLGTESGWGTKGHGPPVPTGSHPSACVVLDLISAKPSSYTTDTHKVQLPACER